MNTWCLERRGITLPTCFPFQTDLSPCSDSALSDTMPDIAMASASLSQIHLQDEFDLDIGDRGSHGTMYIWCISVTLGFMEGLFCFIYYKVLSEITTFVLFIVQSRFLFLFFVVTYQIFFQSHLHVYYQATIL